MIVKAILVFRFESQYLEQCPAEWLKFFVDNQNKIAAEFVSSDPPTTVNQTQH